MKAVILAGGRGSRLSEETGVRPKPMVEIGGKPMLWHIMKSYSAQGVHDFVVCLGYRGYVVKEWFANYALHTSDVTFDLRSGEMEVHHSTTDPWRVTLVDTGEATMTGGRVKRALPYVGGETFCMTYGDGLTDLDLTALIEFHRQHGRLATVTAVQPPGRFGALDLDGAQVRGFREKVGGEEARINGGFFVLEPGAVAVVGGDETVWEEQPMSTLAAQGELQAFRHDGFWQPMDTLRERQLIEDLWTSGQAPWRVWADPAG